MNLAVTRAILDQLIAFPTISQDSNLACIAHCAALLEGAGARVRVLPDKTGNKANLFASFGAERQGGLLLAGHCDVVPVEGQTWSSDPYRLRAQEGRLYGRGTCDMKGFLACVLALAPQWQTAACSQPIHVAITYDEEIGCFGAQDLVAQLRADNIVPQLAILGEPTGMRIVEGHKGCFEYSTRFQGLAGHGSQPDNGVNAVEYAARFVAKLLELREALKARAPDDSQFDPPWTTLNIGAVQGGIAHNVIADEAHIDWEMRPVQLSDAAFVKDALAQSITNHWLPAMRAISPAAWIETDTIGEVVGLLPQKDNAARALLSQLLGQNAAEFVAFGTEAGLYQEAGMDVVVCGPGFIDQAHKPDEYIDEDQLQKCLDMLIGLARTKAQPV